MLLRIIASPSWFSNVKQKRKFCWLWNLKTWDNLGGRKCRMQHIWFFVFVLFCFLALVIIVNLWNINKISPRSLSVCVLQVASCWLSAARSQVPVLTANNYVTHWETGAEQAEHCFFRSRQRCEKENKYVYFALYVENTFVMQWDLMHVSPQKPGGWWG